jgi:Protein of unknown function (DUF2924)
MEDISRKLGQLKTFSRRQLLDLWQELYRRAAPAGLRRELLIPFLSYRLQECTYGGLKPSTRTELRRIARDLGKPGVTTRSISYRRTKTGTRIVRSSARGYGTKRQRCCEQTIRHIDNQKRVPLRVFSREYSVT